MEQQLRRCYFSFISLRGGLLISGSKQKNTGSPFQRVPLSSTAAPSNAIANFSNSIVDPENRSANLIEAAPFPWSEAPAGRGPVSVRAKGTQNAPHAQSCTSPRGHSNIIRRKAIIQAISPSLMMCQHSLSVLFSPPSLFLSGIANFLFILGIHKCARSLSLHPTTSVSLSFSSLLTVAKTFASPGVRS